MTIPDRLRGVSTAVLWLSVAVVLALSVALVAYTEPLADDFCRAILDPYAHLENLYFYWSGRWFSIVSSIEILTRVGLLENYTKLVAALFALTYAAWLVVVLGFAGGRLGAAGTVLASIVLLVLFWTGMPSPGETIYWAIGGMENHFGLFAAACSLALMSRVPHAYSPVARAALVAGAAAFGLIATGCHEASALCLSGITVVACLAAFYTQADERRAWLILTLVVLVGTAVSVGAPGNVNRSRFFADGGDPVRTLQMVAWGMAAIVGPWFLDIKIWAASVLFFATPGTAGAGPLWLRDSMVPWRWIAPGATLLILAGILMAAGWGSGSPGPARLHNFMYAVFLIGWVATLFAWTDRVSVGLRALCTGAGGTVAAFVFAAGLLFSVNTTNAIHDFARNSTHDVAAWQTAIEHRYDFIARAKADGQEHVVVPAPPVHPWSFAKADLSLNTGVPQNACPARFFRLKTLGVEAPPEVIVRPKPRT